MPADDYRAAVKAAADQITLSESQRAALAVLLAGADPRTRLAAAVALRPDLPIGISRKAADDET